MLSGILVLCSMRAVELFIAVAHVESEHTMGQAKTKKELRKTILASQPLCIYCGDPATTIDHCPPRVFFSNRAWPETYEFSACSKCNADTRYDEQALAVLTRIKLRESRTPEDQKDWEKITDGVKNNQPDIVAEWRNVSRNDIRSGLRQKFGATGDNLREEGWGLLNIGPLTTEMINRFLVKLAKALYYQHNKQILGGIIYAHMIDTAAATFTPDYIGTILQMAPESAKLERSKRPLYDQFSYRYNHTTEHEALYAVVQFNEQMMFRILVISPLMEAALIAESPDIQTVLGNRYDCRRP